MSSCQVVFFGALNTGTGLWVAQTPGRRPPQAWSDTAGLLKRLHTPSLPLHNPTTTTTTTSSNKLRNLVFVPAAGHDGLTQCTARRASGGGAECGRGARDLRSSTETEGTSPVLGVAASLSEVAGPQVSGSHGRLRGCRSSSPGGANAARQRRR